MDAQGKSHQALLHLRSELVKKLDKALLAVGLCDRTGKGTTDSGFLSIDSQRCLSRVGRNYRYSSSNQPLLAIKNNLHLRSELVKKLDKLYISHSHTQST
jgi:hypothetical protein